MHSIQNKSGKIVYADVIPLPAPDYNKPKEEKMKETEDIYQNLIQWTSPTTGMFAPSGNSYEKIPEGTYEITQTETGLFFRSIKTKTDNLLKFPDTSMDEVIKEITDFWNNEEVYKKYDIPYRRGILLHGPQGSGKTTTLRFLVKDVVERGGIVINYTGSGMFKEGIRIFRRIQPETPIVVLMEDLDEILRHDNESQLLNILDGNEECHKMVFLATTNFPDRLTARNLLANV